MNIFNELINIIINKQKQTKIENENNKILEINDIFATINYSNNITINNNNNNNNQTNQLFNQTYNYSLIIILEESLLSILINNYAICCLNIKKIKKSIEKFEYLIKLNPILYLNDAIVFNVCTLYDLSHSPETSKMKKKILLLICDKYYLFDPIINYKSFKL